MLPAYAELHCLSNFSFLRGASHPEELVERAAQAGYQALAITDECSLAGAVRAHLAARQAGLPLIVGSELQLARADGTPDLKLVLLPTNRNGYGDLAELNYQLAQCYERLQNHKEAIYFYQQAQQSHPGYKDSAVRVNALRR